MLSILIASHLRRCALISQELETLIVELISLGLGDITPQSCLFLFLVKDYQQLTGINNIAIAIITLTLIAVLMSLYRTPQRLRQLLLRP